MSEQNIAIVRAVYDGWLRGDPATIDMIAEDVVYLPPPSLPGSKTYHGHEGVLQWVVDWRAEWTDHDLELEQVEALGDHVFTVELIRATGKRSGARVETQSYSLWTLRDGKVVRWQGYDSAEEALEAARSAE